jgi:hypothetical protein
MLGKQITVGQLIRINKTEKINSERNFFEAPLWNSDLTIQGEAVGTTKPMIR